MEFRLQAESLNIAAFRLKAELHAVACLSRSGYQQNLIGLQARMEMTQ